MFARRAPWCTAALVVLLAWPAVTWAQPPDEGEGGAEQTEAGEEGEVPEAPAAYHAPPQWDWVQVLAAPRIGARLTAVEVDPNDPNHIWVGSQSGVMFYSADGGVTWRELEPDAFTANRRDVLAPRGGVCVAPDCDEIPLLFSYPSNPERPPVLSETSYVLQQLPVIARGTTFPRGFFIPTYFTRDVGVPQQLLDNALRSRPTEEVRRIVLCPGSVYPLIVATRREVVASPDGGYSWIRLLRFPGRVQTPQVACDPLRTNHLIIASQEGYQESRDGGVTLDPNLAGYPRGAVQAVSFGTDGSVYLGSGFQLFKRENEAIDARRIYPDFNNSQTAPWEPILWIAPEGDEVWVGTQDGLRHSVDHGGRFTQVAPNLFSRQVIPQVVVGRNESGGTRVAAIIRDCPRNARDPTAPGCRGTLVVSSDDDGRHWNPFFQGMTRRSIQQMAYSSGRWFIVTGGELWMSAVATPGAVAQEDVRAARRTLRNDPTLSTVIEVSLDRASLNQEQVNELMDRAYGQAWLPRRLSFHFEADLDGIDSAIQQTGGGAMTNYMSEGDTANSFFYLWAFLEWDLQGLAAISPGGGPQESSFRSRLYRLRQQISFLVEDAWHERRMHLRRIARGFTDPYQAAVLQERIAVLEAILEFWLGDELESFGPSARRR